MRTIIAALALAITPLAAHANTIDPRPTARWPIVDRVDRPRTHIVVQGTSHPWAQQAKRAMRYADEKIRGIIVRNGRCSSHPDYACVRIYVRNYGRTGWVGQVDLGYDWPHKRIIRLNTYPSTYKRYGVALHESAHALGLSHHRLWGAVGTRPRNPVRYSHRELRALRNAY